MVVGIQQKYLGTLVIEQLKLWWYGFGYRKPDKYTPFRYQLKKIKNKNRKGCTLTLADVKQLWERQGGRCPLTGCKMKLKDFKSVSDSPQWYDASIDRLDNSKPYEKGNVRFICVMANYARNNFTDKDLIEFCSHVYRHFTTLS